MKDLVKNKPKIKDRYSNDRNERDYIKMMTLQDTRSWFRMRNRMTQRIKANSSSAFREDMSCRHCVMGITEPQNHMEKCTGVTYEQRGLKIDTDAGSEYSGAELRENSTYNGR